MKEINKTEFIEYFKTHSNASTIGYFNISYDLFYKLLDEYNLLKHTRKENLVLTNIERYGSAEIPKEIQMNIVTKRKLTCLSKYGVDNPMLCDSVKQKLSEYFETTDDSSRILKIKLTKLERYGDANYCNTEKAIQTNLEKYGVKSPSMSSEIKEKTKLTCLDRYGVEYSGQIPEKIEKTKITNSQRWDSDNYCNRLKAKITCKQKYGYEYAMQNEEIKNHASQMVQEKYGVLWNCMRDEARAKGNNSKPNQLFADLLSENTINFEREFVLDRYSYDFKVDNILIEINPTATHNSTLCYYGRDIMDKNYHKDKSDFANQNGYRCINIFDWDDTNKIVNLLLKKETIYARDCTIYLPTLEEAAQFITDNHLLGYAKDSIQIALKYKNQIVSIMTFDKPRYNKNYEYELVRYCSSKNITGGAQKIFKYFINTYNPTSIISYCDKSKFSGNMYLNLGFTLLKHNNPSKHWYNMKTKKHITNNLLMQRGYDLLFNTNYGKEKTNDELMLLNGFLEVYDCGQDSFIWKNQNIQ